MIKVTIKYAPHKAQLPFHQDRYKVRNRGLIGGGGSGKTEAGGFEAMSWAFENPGSVGLICAPTYKMLKRFVIPKLEKLLGVSALENSPFVRDWQKTDMLVTFNTFTLDGVSRPSKAWMVGLDKPESAEGMNLDWAWLDEARLVPKLESARQSILRRLRGSGASAPLDKHVPPNAVGLWVTTTPDAPLSDLFNFFEHPEKRNPESRVYRVTLDDNAENLPPEFVAEMKRSHSGGLYDRFILGRFAAVTGGAFEFDHMIHAQGVSPPELKEVIYGLDFGWRNPSAVIAVGFDGDNRAYVLDEVYATQLSEEALIMEIRQLQERWGESTLWCDSSEPRTIASLQHAGLDARGNKSKREDGIREIGGRLKDAGDGRRRLYVSPDCVNLIEELQLYDPEKKEHDHAVDALRYAVMGAKGYGELMVDTARRPR
jgi:hypothetical protein